MNNITIIVNSMLTVSSHSLSNNAENKHIQYTWQIKRPEHTIIDVKHRIQWKYVLILNNLRTNGYN